MKALMMKVFRECWQVRPRVGACRPFKLAGLALCVAAITVWSIPQPVPACTGTPPPPVCGKSTVLMKTPPTVFTFVPPTPPFILPVPVTVVIVASPAPPPPPCPFPTGTVITLAAACLPPIIPPPFGFIGITTETPGTYSTVVPVGFPALAGPPPASFVCTIVGGAATTWADFSVTTGFGDTKVCLVEGIEDPDNPGEFIPRMDLERLTAEIHIAHPGDQRIHSYLLTNNDPTESVTVTLTADSRQTARLPESEGDETGLGTGPFALADPGDGDNFPIAFVEDMDLSWIPLPPDPPSYGVPVITKEITLEPGESRLVEIAQRSWPMCQSGSCSESLVIVDGEFSNGDLASACAGGVLLTDSIVPPDLDCPDGGVMVPAVLQGSNSVSFTGQMPTHLFDMSVSIPDVTITTEEAGELPTSFGSINLHQDKARITAAGSAMKGPATVVDSLFEVGFTIEVLSNHVEIDTEMINFILHAAVPGFGDTYFGVHPVVRLTGADIPPDLETFFHAFTPGISVDGVTDDLHHLAQIVQDSITLEIVDPTHAAVSFLAVFPSDEGLPLEIDSIRVMIDSMGIATGIPDESEPPMCCDSPALCDGDANGDGAVDPLDSGAILARFGLDASDPANCQYDVNCDGGIDPLDSGYVLARFGICNPVACKTCEVPSDNVFNDNCEDATVDSLSVGETNSYDGDNTDATMTCAAGGFEETWHAMNLQEDADVTLSLCDTDPPFGNAYIVIDPSCPCSGAFVFATAFDQITCTDGNWSMHYNGLPAGVYYTPVLKDATSTGKYTWNISAAGGGDCDPPCGDGEICEDGVCVPAPGVCGPGNGDCCDPAGNGSPGCEDEACCAAICAADPFCCDTEWDSVCADAAVLECAVCDGGGPDNDDCANAVDLFDGVNAFDTDGATTDGPPLPGSCEEGFGLSLVNDIWYDYEASCTGTVTISTCNDANYDTRLAAYDGTGCFGDLAGCNDDGPGCSGFTSVMEFGVTMGSSYKIRVGGFGGSGQGNLTVSCD